MAYSYTRQSTISDGDTITAALFNNEYNQVLNAFAYSSSDAAATGHRHDGSAAQGGSIYKIGDLDFLNKIEADSTNNRWGFYVEVSSSAVEQIRVQDGAIVPVTDNDIDLGTSSLEFKDAYFDGTVTTDALVADTADINGGTVDGATIGASSATTIVGTTITANTAFVPDASDGAALGTTSLEFSDLYLADGAVIYFGDDQDVSLTHVADTGLLLSSTDQLQFGDSGTYIYQSADGVLDLVSDTEIEINATTIDMNGNVDISGTLTVAGALDFGDAALSNVGDVQLDSIAGDGDTNTSITFSGSDVITITAGGDTQFTFNNGSILPTTDDDIDLGSSSYEFKDLYIDGTANIDSLVADTADINGGTVDGATIGANSATTIVGTTITANTAFVPDASDGAALGTSSLEFSDLFLADGAVINLGDDQDTTLTHVADTGILLNSTRQFQFGDSGTYIHQSADGVLDLVSDTEIEINATTVDINGAVEVSGNIDVDGTTNLDAVDIDGAVQIDATVTVGVDDTGYDVKFFGDAASAYMLWDASVDDLILGGAARVVVPDGQLVLGSTAVSSTAAELNILDGKSFVDEDDMSSDSATAIASQQSIKAYVDTNAGSMSNWILEDDDGTEVTISNAKEVKFIGSGVTTNWTDTDNGTDGDPYDLTFTINAAQTGITSLLATDIKIGEDDETKIDFETADEIHFYAANVEQVYLGDNIFGPQSDSDVDLGSTSVRWKDAYVDSITVTGEIDGNSLDIEGNADINGTTNLDAVDIDGTVQIDGATTFGVDDTGVDVKLFGATSGAYLLWDESADKLLTAGNTFVDIVKDKLMIGGTAVTTTAAELNKLDGAGTLAQAGKQTIWIPASAMYPTSTNGCADLAQVETTAQQPEFNVLDFDKDSTEYAQFTVAFPKSWDHTGDITFQVFWLGIASTDEVAWCLQGKSVADGVESVAAFGTAVTVTDASQGDATETLISAESGDVTIAGAADDTLTYFQIYRDHDHGDDDMAGDARLLGIKLFFSTNAANDA